MLKSPRQTEPTPMQERPAGQHVLNVKGTRLPPHDRSTNAGRKCLSPPGWDCNWHQSATEGGTCNQYGADQSNARGAQKAEPAKTLPKPGKGQTPAKATTTRPLPKPGPHRRAPGGSYRFLEANTLVPSPSGLAGTSEGPDLEKNSE